MFESKTNNVRDEIAFLRVLGCVKPRADTAVALQTFLLPGPLPSPVLRSASAARFAQFFVCFAAIGLSHVGHSVF